jgi:hypothetical protein
MTFCSAILELLTGKKYLGIKILGCAYLLTQPALVDSRNEGHATTPVCILGRGRFHPNESLYTHFTMLDWHGSAV